MVSGKKRAVIYSRVSKDASGEARSNERQEEACRGLAVARGWEVVATSRDVSVSAYSGKKREGWNQVRALMENGEVDVVIAWAMDRVTRSMVELEEIIALCERTGVALATATGEIDLTTDTGQMVARILAAVARAEVQRKAARQRLANHQRASEGLPWKSGWQAFGYEIDGTVIPAEAHTFRRTFDAVLEGRWSLKQAARTWTDYKHSSRGAESPANWTPRGVRAVLLNPRYAGIATYRGEEVGEGRWEALITRAEHAQMKALLTDPSRRTNSGRGGRTPTALLTGIAECGECGTTVNLGSSHGREVYKCKSRRECVRTPRGPADEFVLSGVRAAIRVVGPENLIPTPESAVASVPLERIETLRERRLGLTRAFAAGKINESDFAAGSTDLTEQIAELEGEAQTAIGPAVIVDLGTMREEAVRNFDALGLHEQRRLVAHIAEVRLVPNGRGRRNVPINEQVDGWISLVHSDDAVGLADMIRANEEQVSSRKKLASP